MNRKLFGPIPMFLFGGLIAAGLAAIAFQNMVLAGPFSWHIAQSRFKEGLAEILLLAVASAISTRYVSKYGIALAVAIVLFYSRRHNIDYALFLASVYALGILATGVVATRIINRGIRTGHDLDHPAQEFCETFVIGLTFFALVQWLLALAGAGYHAMVISSWIFGLAAIAAAVMQKSGLFPSRMSSATVAPGFAQWIKASIRTDFFCSSAFFLLVFCGLAALSKSNYHVESDSAWYGLRPDRVLFHAGSIFHQANLSAQVFYYPKLYELLVTPLAKTGDNSTVIAFTVICWFAYVVATISIASTFTKNNRILAALALIAGTTPAMINIACTAKGDLLAAALTLIGIAKLLQFLGTWNIRPAIVALAAILLAPLVRLSVLPSAGLVGIYLVIAYGYAVYSGKLPLNPLGNPSRRFLAIALAALAVFLLVSFHTYEITGIPFIAPGQLVSLAAHLGMHTHFPVGSAIDWSGRPIEPLSQLLSGFLFRPASLPHVMIYWTGNVWLVLAFLALAASLFPVLRARLRMIDGIALFILLSIGSLLFAILAFMHMPAGGDGNYYIVPVTGLILGFLLLGRSLPPSLIAGVSLGSAAICIPIFMMSALWWAGTLDFDGKLTRNPFDQVDFATQQLDSSSLFEVSATTGQCGPDISVVGALQRPAAYLLPYRLEALQDIVWANSASFRTDSSFADYLRATAVDLVILPKPTAAPEFLASEESPAFNVARKAANELQIVAHAGPIAESKNFLYYPLSSAGERCITPHVDPCAALATSDEIAAGQTVSGVSSFRHSTFWFEPAAMNACAPPARLMVHWDIDRTKTRGVEIRVVNGSSEQLFARGLAAGSQVTGPWMKAGTQMVVRSQADGALLACATVASTPCKDHK